MVLGALDAVTSQIKVTSHRGGGGVAGVVGRESDPVLSMPMACCRRLETGVFASQGPAAGQWRTGGPAHGGQIIPGAQEELARCLFP